MSNIINKQLKIDNQGYKLSYQFLRALSKMTGKHELTDEEFRVLTECSSESFWYRCLPLEILGGYGTYYAVQNGYLKGHQKFGAKPHIALVIILAYFIGKLSYVSKCEDKILALPNSPLAEMIREQRRAARRY